MYGTAFNKCSGCSDVVVDAYKANRSDFIWKACNQMDYLEDLTGLSEMKENIDMLDIESFGSDLDDI